MNSSWIFDTARIDGTNDVELTLENGSTYCVENVSDSKLRDWRASDSAGTFFNQNVRNQHSVSVIG